MKLGAKELPKLSRIIQDTFCPVMGVGSGEGISSLPRVWEAFQIHGTLIGFWNRAESAFDVYLACQDTASGKQSTSFSTDSVQKNSA